jgi:hypothetical protein
MKSTAIVRNEDMWPRFLVDDELSLSEAEAQEGDTVVASLFGSIIVGYYGHENGKVRLSFEADCRPPVIASRESFDWIRPVQETRRMDSNRERREINWRAN